MLRIIFILICNQIQKGKRYANETSGFDYDLIYLFDYWTNGSFAAAEI